MKILLVANTDWYLYNFRRSLAAWLKEPGREVVLVSPPGPYAEKLRELGFRWIAWDVGRKSYLPWNELRSIRAIAKIYRDEKPDLVHHHTIKPAIYGSIAAQLTRVKAVVNSITGRGYVFMAATFKARMLRTFASALYRLAFRPRNCIAVFQNSTDRDYFVEQRLISESRVRLIEGSGVDTRRFAQSPEPDGPPVVMMASRMLWDKGVGVLVEAARRIKARRAVRIVLAGTPDPGNPTSVPEETLRGWDKEGVVEWWGFQSDMNRAYSQSHIVVLPSFYYEGVPISLLEAAACGRPIVTTTIPGCRDFVTDGHNGLLTPPQDPELLAEAIERLIDDPALRQRMGAAGRQRVLEKYTVEIVNAATLAVYQELLSPEPQASITR